MKEMCEREDEYETAIFQQTVDFKSQMQSKFEETEKRTQEYLRRKEMARQEEERQRMSELE